MRNTTFLTSSTLPATIYPDTEHSTPVTQPIAVSFTATIRFIAQLTILYQTANCCQREVVAVCYDHFLSHVSRHLHPYKFWYYTKNIFFPIPFNFSKPTFVDTKITGRSHSHFCLTYIVENIKNFIGRTSDTSFDRNKVFVNSFEIAKLPSAFVFNFQ